MLLRATSAGLTLQAWGWLQGSLCVRAPGTCTTGAALEAAGAYFGWCCCLLTRADAGFAAGGLCIKGSELQHKCIGEAPRPAANRGQPATGTLLNYLCLPTEKNGVPGLRLSLDREGVWLRPGLLERLAAAQHQSC